MTCAFANVVPGRESKETPVVAMGYSELKTNGGFRAGYWKPGLLICKHIPCVRCWLTPTDTHTLTISKCEGTRDLSTGDQREGEMVSIMIRINQVSSGANRAINFDRQICVYKDLEFFSILCYKMSVQILATRPEKTFS